MSGSCTKRRDKFFPCETWSVDYESYSDIAIWSCTDTLYFTLRAEKMFCMKILLILAKFHEKTLIRSGDMKIFRPGRRMYMYTPLRPPPPRPPAPKFIYEVLSKERQLMKWVGIFQVGFSGRGIFLELYYTLKNIKKSYKNNKFKISVPTWNEDFELRDGSYLFT